MAEHICWIDAGQGDPLICRREICRSGQGFVTVTLRDAVHTLIHVPDVIIGDAVASPDRTVPEPSLERGVRPSYSLVFPASLPYPDEFKGTAPTAKMNRFMPKRSAR